MLINYIHTQLTNHAKEHPGIFIVVRSFRNFVNSLDSEESKKHYSKIFRYFMTYCNADNYEDMLEIEPKRLEGLIRDYIIHLKENKRSSSTINSYIASITHFYEMNDIVLRWKKLNKFKGKHRSVADDRPYTRSQIKTLLEYAGALRDRCIILLMASAGLRRGALPMLKIQDLTPIDFYKIYKIRVYAREEEEYFTYCTPECRRLLDQYPRLAGTARRNAKTNLAITASGIQQPAGTQTSSNDPVLDYCIYS